MNQYVLNMSTVLGHLPLTERPAAAREMGFDRVESWWDFASATPLPAEVDGFVDAIHTAGVQLVAINSHGGDRNGKERGLACLPGRVDEFRASIMSVCNVASRTGARKFNVTIGEMLPSFSKDAQFDQAVENYRWAAQQVSSVEGMLLIEPLSGQGKGEYPFRTGYDAVGFINHRLEGVDNVKLLFDTYHLAANGIDVITAWDALASYVGHIQLADFPGRGRPGAGNINFAVLLDRVHSSGYSGDIAYEYIGS